MENKNNEMICVTVYADNTGLFTEEECNCNNTVDLIVPYWVAKEWYLKNENENKRATMHELDVPEEEATFDRWFSSVYICEDFDGFYDYCIIKGVIPNLDSYDYCIIKGIAPIQDLEYKYDNRQYKICYEDYNGNIQTLFEGTYDECRRHGRVMKWKYFNFESEIGEWKKYNLFLDSCF